MVTVVAVDVTSRPPVATRLLTIKFGFALLSLTNDTPAPVLDNVVFDFSVTAFVPCVTYRHVTYHILCNVIEWCYPLLSVAIPDHFEPPRHCWDLKTIRRMTGS